MRSARALLGINQQQLATMAGLSVPVIQRMEASDDIVRGDVDSLMKLVAALDRAGIEFMAPSAVSQKGGRGVRFFGREEGGRVSRTKAWAVSGIRAA